MPVNDVSSKVVQVKSPHSCHDDEDIDGRKQEVPPRFVSNGLFRLLGGTASVEPGVRRTSVPERMSMPGEERGV